MKAATLRGKVDALAKGNRKGGLEYRKGFELNKALSAVPIELPQV
ncbi:hypothetical protein [Thalassotalea euphylliae]|nr:hypothetical protein [Thalassotalea euphylliae]